jgi:hypothetical protein
MTAKRRGKQPGHGFEPAKEWDCVLDKKYSVFLATPMYNGMAAGIYTEFFGQLYSLMTALGIPIQHSFGMGCSLVPKARNFLVEEFLASNATHMLLVDADIGADPTYVLQMLILQAKFPFYNVLGATYLQKNIHWDRVHAAVLSGVEPDLLCYHTGIGTMETLEECPICLDISQPFPVKSLGAGFLLVRRNVFTKFREAYPDRAFGDNKFLYFQSEVIDNAYTSEDIAFCKMAREMGEKVYVCPWMDLSHFGSNIFGRPPGGYRIGVQ